MLHGKGVYNLDEALSKLRLQPVHEALRALLSPVVLEPLIEAAEEKRDHPTPRDDQRRLNLNGRGIHSSVAAIVERAEEFYRTVAELTPSSIQQVPAPDPENLAVALQAVARLPRLVTGSRADWPPTARIMLPSDHPSKRASAVWAPVIAWGVLKAISDSTPQTLHLFDELQLRAGLAEVFANLGLEGEDAWRAAARIRILLSGTYKTAGLHSESASPSMAFWNEPDVRWLLGVNASEGVTWFNRECLEEMFWWLQLPVLARELEKKVVDPPALSAIHAQYAAHVARAKKAGYRFDDYLASFIQPVTPPAKPAASPEPEPVPESEAAAEAKPAAPQPPKQEPPKPEPPKPEAIKAEAPAEEEETLEYAPSGQAEPEDEVPDPDLAPRRG
jgi:hypothetical protein